MIGSLQTFTNATQSQKMRAFAISYKPFASIFNMTGVAETYPQLAGVGECQPGPESGLVLNGHRTQSTTPPAWHWKSGEKA